MRTLSGSADKAGRGRLSQKEVMSWLGTSEKFTLAAVRFQSKDFMNVTADQSQENLLPAKHLASLSPLVFIYRPGNYAT